MSAKHTPGPWEIHGAVFVWSPSEHQVVCAISEPEPGSGMVDYEPVKVSSPNFSTATANARLIAAAPDLLEALESALKNVKFEQQAFRPWHADAIAAIAKAKGE